MWGAASWPVDWVAQMKTWILAKRNPNNRASSEHTVRWTDFSHLPLRNLRWKVFCVTWLTCSKKKFFFLNLQKHSQLSRRTVATEGQRDPIAHRCQIDAVNCETAKRLPGRAHASPIGRFNRPGCERPCTPSTSSCAVGEWKSKGVKLFQFEAKRLGP